MLHCKIVTTKYLYFLNFSIFSMIYNTLFPWSWTHSCKMLCYPLSCCLFFIGKSVPNKGGTNVYFLIYWCFPGELKVLTFSQGLTLILMDDSKPFLNWICCKSPWSKLRLYIQSALLIITLYGCVFVSVIVYCHIKHRVK